MSIRSVDLMVLYSKTTDVEKMHQTQQQSPQVTQQQIAAAELQKKEIQKSKVAETAKSEDGKVERKKDGDEGKRPTYGHNLKQQKDEDAQAGENRKNMAENVTKPSIDIRI